MLRKTIVTFCLIIPWFSLLAQPGDPGGDPDVPITGIEILIGAGALLGVKRAIGHKKNKS